MSVFHCTEQQDADWWWNVDVLFIFERDYSLFENWMQRKMFVFVEIRLLLI